MFISDSFVFVHIKKTGGTSLTNMVRRDNTKYDIVYHPITHSHLNEIAADTKNLFKFTIIRNPYHRMCSLYNNVLRNRVNKNLDAYSFDEFVYRNRNNDTVFQSYYLDVQYDKIYRTELFNEMLVDLQERFDFTFKKTLYIGSRFQHNRNYDSYYTSSKTRDIVRRKEASVFKIFDYELT
jgi:hypothetical protein